MCFNDNIAPYLVCDSSVLKFLKKIMDNNNKQIVQLEQIRFCCQIIRASKTVNNFGSYLMKAGILSALVTLLIKTLAAICTYEAQCLQISKYRNTVTDILAVAGLASLSKKITRYVGVL
eukprot:265989_1